jgi:hypothetical protein
MRPSMMPVGYFVLYVAAVALVVDIGWTWG